MSGWVFLGAPADSVSRGGGAELAPRRLRELDLPRRLGAADAGDLLVPIRGDDRDPVTGLIASDHVVANAATIRDAVAVQVAAGECVFLSGGCCAIAPAAVGGVRSALGRALELVYVDGHQDLWDGRTSPTGEAADMPLGVAIGRGPAAWVDALGGAPVRPADVALLGNRDDAEASAAGLPMPAELGITHLPLADVRELGPANVGERVVSSARDYWLHLDVDVLDPESFPATDYLDPGGLAWPELVALLTPICEAPSLRGVSLGCFNPEKDRDGSAGARLADVLADVLAA